MLKGLPQDMWLDVEDFSSFERSGVKIWAVLDCSYRTEDDGITIIDWKTGKTTSGNVPMQLSCYAMYAMDRWGLEDPSDIGLIEYSLLVDKPTEFSISDTDIESTKAYIAGSVADMRSLLSDRTSNTPKEEDAFRRIEDGEACADCNSQKVCR